jgi:ATP-binding cassette subfamily C (CFTR/MRP) protein 1
MRLVDMTLPAAFINASFMLANSLSSTILTVISVKYIAAALPFIFATVYTIQRFYLRTSRQLRLLELEAKAPLYADFVESLAGITTIRAFGWSDKALARNLKLLDTSLKPYYLLLCIQQWLTLVLDIIVAIIAILLVSVAVNLRSKINASLLGVALVNVMNLSQSLTNLVTFWTRMETSLGAIARVKAFVRDTISEDSSTDYATVQDNWPARGDLSFQNVSVAYGYLLNLISTCEIHTKGLQQKLNSCS